MKTVSLNSLKDWGRSISDRHPDGKPNVEFVAFGIAVEYLRAVVGNEWTNQMVFPQHRDLSHANRQGRVFMKTDENEIEQRVRNQDRTLRIAELLFNLQCVAGIDGRLDALRRGNVEAIYTELEVGKFLLRQAVSFKYVDEVGVKGLDYDGQIFLHNNERVNCEMKCKIESTELSEGAIRNALDTARKQLPPSEQGIIFLKIPESWVHEVNIGTLLLTTINDFLRGTSRVIAVILYWEEVYLQAGKSAAIVANKYRIERGIVPKNVSHEVQKMLDQLSGPETASWVSFQTIAKETIQGAG